MALKLFSLAVSAASAAWMLQGCGGDEKNAAKAKKGEKNPNPPLSGGAKKPPADEKPPPKSVVEQASRKLGRVGDSPVVLANTQRGPVREEALKKGHAVREEELQQQYANAVLQYRQTVVDPEPEQPRKQPRAAKKRRRENPLGAAPEPKQTRVAKRPRQEGHAGKTELLQQYVRVQHDVYELKQRRAQARSALKSGLLKRDQRNQLSRDRVAWKKQLKQKYGSLKQLQQQLQQQWKQKYGSLKQLQAAMQELTVSRNRMLQRTRDEPELH